MGFLKKSIVFSLVVIGVLYGIWWVFLKYSVLTIATFIFIVISLIVLSGLSISLYAKVNEK